MILIDLKKNEGGRYWVTGVGSRLSEGLHIIPVDVPLYMHLQNICRKKTTSSIGLPDKVLLIACNSFYHLPLVHLPRYNVR